MEKIVTKIGDVTIERRVTKPQHPKEISAHSNLKQANFPLQKVIARNEEQLRSFSQSQFNKQELPLIHRNVPKPVNKNITQKTIKSGNFDLKSKKPQLQYQLESSGNFPMGEIDDIQVSAQKDKVSEIPNVESSVKPFNTRESGINLSKPNRTEMVLNPLSVSLNQNHLPNGPDLSKYSGVSIERKRKVNFDLSPSKIAREEYPHSILSNSNISVKRIPSNQKSSIESIDLKSQEELVDDFEDSFDEEDYEDENIPLDDEMEIPENFREPAIIMSEEEPEKSEPEEIALSEEDFMKKEDEGNIEGLPIKEESGKEIEGEMESKESDINDLVCTDLMELMQKGEIEGEIEDVKDEEMESEEKKGEKRKAEGDDEEKEGEENAEGQCSIAKKKKNKSDEDENDEQEDDEEDEEEKDKEENEDEKDEKNIDKSKVTNANLRKNIREVMDETKLDEATLAAQRQEAERLKRLQEQQKIIREVQRQIALNRQNQKSQNKVLSLLQGNSQTSILKTSSSTSLTPGTQLKNQNSVLVKLSNGEQTSLNNKKMMELLKHSKSKTIMGKPPISKTLLKQGMVTPSVSIAPIAKKETLEDDKKKKKGDIVTLSSDSEDDCIVLSDEDESEPEEDPTNSGMHTNDKYNLPDEKGRVIVNVGHPESESDLYLAPQIARIIKPHQIGGIRFLYDNVIESIDRFQNSTGFGCILAHSMGLGKTLQIVSFSDIFLRYTSARTILCIMPINTIQNWLAEFNMWLPKESLSEDIRCRDFDLFIVNESLKNINSRAKVILDWQKSGGVLLMGYELFRLLSLKKSYKSKKKKRDTEENDAKNKELIEEVYSALVIPGPDLVICDEGHRIKNSHATTSQALKQIRTKRRIVLTGYPLQNNLLEYWCMVDFVRPNYLGTKTEFSNMFERPIQNGQCIDSTPQDKRLMRYRAHVLHSLLEGFVQRRSHAVLQSTLPEKEEYVLLLRFTPFQRKLYDTFMNEVVRTVAVPNPLKAFAVCCKIWNHPDVLYNFLKKKGEEIDLDLEEALPPSLQNSQFPYVQQSTGPDGMIPPGSTPGIVPWPRRGPGSRGGKVRQPKTRGVGRGRKPAATILPNIPHEKDNFNSRPFPPGESFPNQQETLDNYQEQNYNQNQFGFSGSYANTNYSKNRLNSLEDMSQSNYQNKRFFSQSNTGSSQNQFESQTFEPDGNFNPNTSNDSNLNSNFESTLNLNSNESNFNQSETAKSFDFNQDFSSEFYSSSNYPIDKSTGYQNNSYYQNHGFRNSENFDYQSSANSLNANFQNYEASSSNFQNSNSSFSGSASNFQRNTNFQGSGSSQRMGGGNVVQGPGFQNPAQGNSFPESGSNPNFQTNFERTRSNESFSGQTSGSNFEQGVDFQGQNQGNFQGNNYDQGFWPQSDWGFPDTSSKGSTEFGGSTATNDFIQQNFERKPFEDRQEIKKEEHSFENGNNNNSAIYDKKDCDFANFGKAENDSKVAEFEEHKASKPKEEEEDKKEEGKSELQCKKDDTSLAYDWAADLFKTYVTGVIENSSKMEVFFHIVTESIKLGDRLLVFSQSLLTLDLIEDYLHRQNVPDKEETWAKNRNYFRLDGSTPGLEREKLINEFNSNPNIHIFLVSTRAGSLGINLVGANRVVVFDASWNPCHDTQAVCRVYRYGQRKQCFVYRLVMDSCLEKKIYDRQVNKQGMADRVVDELNPDAHLSIKEVTNLCWDDQEDTIVKDFSNLKDKYNDEIIKILLDRCSKLLSKEPFQHESLLIDRKEKKLSQAEKRLAKRSYELEKQAANQPKNIYSFFPNSGQRNFAKPIASVRPMQSEINSRLNPQLQNRSKWIPAEVWQKQGMSAQEMTLPLDVVIPTSSPEKTSIVLKAGQRVMVLKSPKGIYMQLENGKIIAIRSAFKVGQNGPGASNKGDENKKDNLGSITPSLKTNAAGKTPQPVRPGLMKPPFLKPFNKFSDKKVPVNMAMARSRQIMGKAKPFMLNRKFESVTPDVKQRLLSGKTNFGSQEEKFNLKEQQHAPISEKRPSIDEIIESNNDKISLSEEKIIDEGDKKTDGRSQDKTELCGNSLETLRKVTERISEPPKNEVSEEEHKYPQMSSLKNYRHNFTSQMKGNSPVVSEEEKKNVEEEANGKKVDEAVSNQHGNENVQNWLMNQSYPPVDPYGNYFPGYYAYGPGPGPMMPPYDGFYPPSNYGHMMGRNSPMMPPQGKQQQTDITKGNTQQAQPSTNQGPPNSAPRNPSSSNNPPMYPPYPNPYSYPYNYPANPSFNNQGFPFPNQNQPSSGQQAPQQTNPPSAGNSASGQNQQPPYDNSMYSAFHRPDAPFQAPENSYPNPYPRTPYGTNGTPSFYPYNAPYPNYPYGPNFNPYMHPGGYGYPMQNPPSSNSSSSQNLNSETGPGHNATSGSNS